MHRLGLVASFAATTLLFTYPLSTSPGSEALDLGPDTRLFLWTLAWDAHALLHEPLSIFDANIFHPHAATLAYSEHQMGSALFAAPLLWATGNLLLSMNGVLLLSCFLSGVFAFYLGRQLGLGIWGALVLGLVFQLSPPRFFRLGQLHLATVQWMPLCLALLHRYSRGGSRRHLVAAATAFSLQALSGGQTALFLALAAAGLVAYLLLFGEIRPASSGRRDAALVVLLLVGCNLPFALPYLEARRELLLERSLDEARSWSPNPESFLASPTHLHRWVASAAGLGRRLGEANAYLFPGAVPLLLALAAFLPGARARPDPAPARPSPPRDWLAILDGAIVAAFAAALAIEAAGGVRSSWITASGGRRAALFALLLLAVRLSMVRLRPFAFASDLLALRERFRSFVEPRFGVAGGFYLLLAAASLWASLGPSAGLYAALYRLVPGFDFIRVPSRLSLVTLLALAVLAGIGAERLRSLFTRGRLVAAVVVALTLVELAAFPLPTRPYAIAISPMDRFLAHAEPGPVAVFPVPDPRDTIAAASRHSSYMLQSTEHFLPLVNGYSGFTPESHDRLFRSLVFFPDAEALSELESLGVRYAVFHRDGYDDAGWQALRERIGRHPDRLELRASYEEGLVYEISPDRRDRGSSGASRSRSSSVPPGSGR